MILLNMHLIFNACTPLVRVLLQCGIYLPGITSDIIPEICQLLKQQTLICSETMEVCLILHEKKTGSQLKHFKWFISFTM